MNDRQKPMEKRKYYFELFKYLTLVNMALIGAIGGSALFNLDTIMEFSLGSEGLQSQEDFLSLLKGIAGGVCLSLISILFSLVGLFCLSNIESTAPFGWYVKMSVACLILMTIIYIYQITAFLVY